jgi:hypothetical protein
MVTSHLSLLSLFLYGLYNEAGSNSDYVASNGKWNDWNGFGRERLWPVLRYYLGIFPEWLGKTSVEISVSQPRFQLIPCLTQVRQAIAWDSFISYISVCPSFLTACLHNYFKNLTILDMMEGCILRFVMVISVDLLIEDRTRHKQQPEWHRRTFPGLNGVISR